MCGPEYYYINIIYCSVNACDVSSNMSSWELFDVISSYFLISFLVLWFSINQFSCIFNSFFNYIHQKKRCTKKDPKYEEKKAELIFGEILSFKIFKILKNITKRLILKYWASCNILARETTKAVYKGKKKVIKETHWTLCHIHIPCYLILEIEGHRCLNRLCLNFFIKKNSKQQMGETHCFWNIVSKKWCIEMVSGLVWQHLCDLVSDPAFWPQAKPCWCQWESYFSRNCSIWFFTIW